MATNQQIAATPANIGRMVAKTYCERRGLQYGSKQEVCLSELELAILLTETIRMYQVKTGCLTCVK